ncbi:AMP-binding protein [Actinomadura rupiterrae]|uniref:AMP-binding protein n=1 Tax=Actinomadura rupiterrae TaxID=559627 RepID=UPI0020A4825E|nr:AMP-binding protein [Actinomadura rupiterrae]MCP2336291.1 acyl-coenzyme A synthetase/AMP-(fatty) acid ligase [Actinomadura rupiterrae]
MPEGEAGTGTVAEPTVTRAVLASAREHAARFGGRPALVDPDRRIGFGAFAALVPAAATGLHRHGVRSGDVAAVQLAGVAELTLAVHALCAAGAVPAPLPLDATVGELARMMTECGARFLVTGGEVAAAALAATERSYVRQAFAFGEYPGATSFARLVGAGAAGGTAARWGEQAAVWGDTAAAWGDAGGGSHGEGAGVGSAGPSGPPPEVPRDPALRLFEPPVDLTHADRFGALHRLAAVTRVRSGDVLVCGVRDCRPDVLIGLSDLCLAHGATLVGVPEPEVAPLLHAIGAHHATAAVVTPEKLRALTFDHAPVPVPDVRLLVTGDIDPEVARACHHRHGWSPVPVT